jgi:hypothetical protein
MALPCRKKRTHDGACLHCTIEESTAAIVAAIRASHAPHLTLWQRIKNLFR